MPLARTPPQRVQRQAKTPAQDASDPEQPPSDGPSSKIASRNPGVTGTPPSGYTQDQQQSASPSGGASTSAGSVARSRQIPALGTPPRPVRAIPPELLPPPLGQAMDVDDPAVEAASSVRPASAVIEDAEQPVAGPSTPPISTMDATTHILPTSLARLPQNPTSTSVSTPTFAPTTGGVRTPAPTTPAPSTTRPPRSTRKDPARSAYSAQVLDTPAVPIPGDALEYGRRWELTMSTLGLAVRAGAQKWSVADLETCFPLLAADHPEAMRNVWSSASEKMKSSILENAKLLMEHYKAGPALQLIDQVVLDAREYAEKHDEPRPDAWRAELSPYALTAATNLPLYDEAYARLREEYIALHDDCSRRYASILLKQSSLAALETSVSDGVVELEKTIEVLDGFPSAEMMNWTEDVTGHMEGARVAPSA